MSCRCANSTLKLFIKSLTRIELGSASQLSTTSPSKRHWSSGSGPRKQVKAANFFKNKKTDEEIFKPKKRLPEDAAKSGGQRVNRSFNPRTTDKHNIDDVYNSFNKNEKLLQGQRMASEDDVSVVSISDHAINSLAAESRKRTSQSTTESPFGAELKNQYVSTEYGRSSDAIRSSYKDKGRHIIDGSAQRSQAGQNLHRQEEGPQIAYPIREREQWMTDKEAIKRKFGDQPWAPKKRLSPDALSGIRAIHAQFPAEYTTEVLAKQFEVSPEAIRRILKSKWQPTVEEEIDRQERWFKRGESVWKRWSELGVKPPKRWRDAGVQEGPGIGERRRILKEETRGSSGRSWKKGRISSNDPSIDEEDVPLTTERTTAVGGEGPTPFV